MKDNITKERNELLFWKVIHNKYLLSKIIETIQNTEWYEYDDPYQIRHDNRILFKNITSLQWIVDNKQYQLLKCKLIAGEQIYLYDYNIKLLINGVGGETDQTISEQCKESLELLLKYQGSKIEGLNKYLPLIPIALKCVPYNLAPKSNPDPDLDVIKMLANHFKSYCADSTIIEWVVCNSTIEILDTLINMPSFDPIKLPKQTKDKLISMAFENRNCKPQMVRYILNNPTLYSVPLVNDKIGCADGNIIKIDVALLLSNYPLDIQIQLINLNYFKFTTSTMDSNQKEMIIKIMSDSENKNKTKDIHKSLVVMELEPITSSTSSLYFSYVVNYNEIINDINIDASTKESTENYLKYIKLHGINEIYIKYFQNRNGSKGFPNLSTMNNELLFWFIKVYTSSCNLNVLGKDESTVMETIFQLNKFDYESLIQSIKPTLSIKFINRFPISWNNLLPQLLKKSTIITISNKETIEWIYESSEIGWPKFQYDNCELLKYAFTKFSLIEKLKFKKEVQLEYPFIKALSNCDIIELENIGKISNSKQVYQSISFNNLQFKNQLSSSIVSLTEYLNGNKYLLGDNCDRFIKQLLLATIYNPEFKLKDIKLNSSLFPTLNNCLQRELLHPINPKRVKLLFENDEFPKHILNGYTEDGSGLIIFKNIGTIDSGNKAVCISPLKVTVEGIISSIEIVINQFNIHSTGKQDNLIILENIINYQYRQLLAIRPVLPVDRLKYVYKLIMNNGAIKLKHSLYTSFHYICIKSIKLEKYILSLPFIFQLNEKHKSSLSDKTGYYETYSQYIYKGYDIGKYLSPNVFTFEYMFSSGASFDEILGKLIHHLSHLPGCTDNEMVYYESVDNPWVRDLNNYYDRSLNHNLAYLLEIKRIDLFHKEYNLFKDFEESFIKLHDKNKKYGYYRVYPSDTVIRIASKILDKSTYEILKNSNPYDNEDDVISEGEEVGAKEGAKEEGAKKEDYNNDDGEDDILGL